MVTPPTVLKWANTVCNFLAARSSLALYYSLSGLPESLDFIIETTGKVSVALYASHVSDKNDSLWVVE